MDESQISTFSTDTPNMDIHGIDTEKINKARQNRVAPVMPSLFSIEEIQRLNQPLLGTSEGAIISDMIDAIHRGEGRLIGVCASLSGNVPTILTEMNIKTSNYPSFCIEGDRSGQKVSHSYNASALRYVGYIAVHLAASQPGAKHWVDWERKCGNIFAGVAPAKPEAARIFSDARNRYSATWDQVISCFNEEERKYILDVMDKLA